MDARQQVLQEIANLEVEVQIRTSELDAITSAEQLDPVQYNAIKAELDNAQGKLDAKQVELANLDAAGEAAQAELSEALDNIDIGGETVSLRVLASDEASYQLIYIALQERFTAQAQSHAQIVAALKSSYESQIEEQRNELAEVQNLRHEVYRLTEQCTDLEAKREAAGNQIQEAQDEINRLKTDNDNLRKQIEDSAKPKESTEDGRAALERWKNSRPAIYNVRWDETTRKTHYLANLAANDEEIRFSHLELGKYRVVEQEEVSQFRTTEQNNEPVQTDVVPDMALVGGVTAPEIQFQAEEVPGSLSTEQVHGRVVYTPEEVAEKLDELERRLDQIAGVGRVA